MQHAIYVRHRSRVVVPPGDGGAPPQYLASLLTNLEGLGFTASAALIAHLRTCSVEQLERLAADLDPRPARAGRRPHRVPADVPQFPGPGDGGIAR